MEPAILAHFPRNTAEWPMVQAVGHSRWMPRIASDDGARIERLIVHCDLVTMSDPDVGRALAVVQLARRITAVNVKPDIARLAVQFSARVSGRVASIARGNFSRIPGPPDRAGQIRYVEQMRRTVLELYSRPDWVERLYEKWNADLARLASGASLRTI